jgi:UDP-GlcNAc:undecaprenyl-phosphate/decaprenyl-phosphate GlcNAc-1-phosphate transferase
MGVVLILKLFFAILISFLITFYLVPVLAAFAVRLRMLDVPDGKIKNHEKATPYLGGVAVYIGFLTSLALVYPFENQILLFIVGSTLLLFVGLIDDLLRSKPYQKFFGQSIAALCFLKAGFHLKELFFLSNYWNIPISFFWIMSVINAFNLVDVMDGLATILATCATISFMIIALSFGHYNLALLLGALVGSLVAFFWYNRPPAKIYLGDAGSLFIGGFLATVPFLFNWSLYNWYGFLTPVLILAIPLLEVTFLVIIRSYKGIPFYQGSPDHFCLYLKMNGWTIWEILGYMILLSIILMHVSLAFAYSHMSFLQLIGLGAFFLSIWIFSLCYKRKSRRFS